MEKQELDINRFLNQLTQARENQRLCAHLGKFQTLNFVIHYLNIYRPACWDVDMLVKMLDAGMDVARLDFSEADQKIHGECLENLALARQQRPERHCAVMLDTRGPEICTGFMRDGKTVPLVSGQNLKIVNDMAIEGDATKIACTYKSLPQTVSVGSVIYIGNGDLTCEVTETHDVSYCFSILKFAFLGFHYGTMQKRFCRWRQDENALARSIDCC